MALHEKYSLKEIIGTGTYGTVYKCKVVGKRHGETYAVKKIKVMGLKSKEKENLNRELNTLKVIKHANIVQMIDYFLIDDQLCIVMEFCAGGTLKQYIERKRHIKENTCLRILQEMCEAVQFLYLNATIHRDIKTTNVLLTIDKTVKLADFGIAKTFDSPEMMKLTIFVGTPNYMSPEMILGKPYDHKVDVWGIGGCLYEMMAKKLLFETYSFSQLKELMINYEEPETSNLPYSKELVNMLKQLLKKDSVERPTPVAILLWITKCRQKRSNENNLQRHACICAGNGLQQDKDSSTRSFLENSQEQHNVHSPCVSRRDSHDPNTPGSATQLTIQSQILSSTRESEDDNSETSGYESAQSNMTRGRRSKSPMKIHSSSPNSYNSYFADKMGDELADEMNDIVRQTLDMPEDEFLVTLEQLVGTRIIAMYKKDILTWRKVLKPWQNSS